MTPHKERRGSDNKSPRKKFPYKGNGRTSGSHSERSHNKKDTLYTGSFSLTARGFGFVAIEGKEDDIFIPERATKDALHSDTVEIRIVRAGDRPEGEITRVVKRAKSSFVGTVIRENDKLVVRPDNRRFPGIIHITNTDQTEGTKVLVQISTWNKAHFEGEVLEVIGTAGEHETEMRAIVLDKNIDTHFPAEVDAEAEAEKEEWSPIPDAEIALRRDMRGTTTFTIDPHDAKDFDDALSIREISESEIEVGIHIADVSHFVREGSLLDKEARKRATSTYLVDRTIPMLPEILSNDLCSLNPHTDKLAFSAIFTLDRASASVKERWFGKTIIHSDRRFTYEDAQKVITAGDGEYASELTTLNAVAHILRKKKLAHGAIDFGDDEVEFELAPDGTPIAIKRKERLDAHRLVEEYMLLANREVATYFYREYQKQSGSDTPPFLYRVHATPDPEKIEMLALFVRALGHELPISKGGEVSAKDLNALFKKMEGHASEALVRTSAVRSMAKAAYSTQNIGHFGLAFEYYTHFTSPIRRYADLIVHRTLHLFLEGKKLHKGARAEFERIAREISEREIEAVSAERESIKYKQVEYMSAHIGEEFDAIISGVTDWGIYVEEVATKSEGLIRAENIPGDTYTLDQKNYALIGETSGTTLSLGEKVRVRLTGANMEARALDFELVR